MAWIDLAGRVAAVTGAASGIGRACAEGLAAVGATVLLLDRDAEGARAVAATLPGARHHALDVASDAQWRTVEAWIAAEFGRLDILVNSAGVVGQDRVGDPDLAVHDRLFAINVDGSLLGMRTALGFMRAAGRGAIVNLASLASVRGSSIMASYGASKAAIAHYTRSCAIEVAGAGHDIRVNSVHPGVITTPMGDDFTQIYASIGDARAVEKAMTLNRFGRPDEVADLVVFLCSDRASYISGANISIDGGKSA